MYKAGNKGLGVRTTRAYNANDYVLAYFGERLVGKQVCDDRFHELERDPKVGSFLFFFSYKGKVRCVDATKESLYKGRLLNHSRKNATVRPKVLEWRGEPHIVFLAKRELEKGTVLEFDYGEKDRDILKENPWLEE